MCISHIRVTYVLCFVQPFITMDGSLNDTVSLDPVPAGGLFTLRVFIKTPPQSVADWTFRADVGDDTDIWVCSVHIFQYGYALPCLNETTAMRSIARPRQHGYQTGWLDLYKLSNVGQSSVIDDDQRPTLALLIGLFKRIRDL